MKFGKLTALALAGILTFAACKYEKGPRISFRTKRDRVANEWLVEKFLQDGVDVTNKVTKDSTVTKPIPATDSTQAYDSIIHYKFTTLLIFNRTGAYSTEICLVTTDKNNNPVYTNNLQAGTSENNFQGFTNLYKAWPLYQYYMQNLISPFKYIYNRGSWSFDKGHYKIQVKPELSYVNDETGNAKNTLDWTIVGLAEKRLVVKGLDENNKPWLMELKAINKEDYFY